MHAGKNHKGCNKMRFHFYFLVEVLLLLLLLGAAAAAHDISTEAEVLLFLFWWLRCCCSSLIERDGLKKNKIGFCFLFDTGTQSIAFSVIGYVLLQPQVPANISTEAERGTGYCFFFLRFCPLQCDALHVYCCCCSWLLLFLSFRLRCFG